MSVLESVSPVVRPCRVGKHWCLGPRFVMAGFRFTKGTRSTLQPFCLWPPATLRPFAHYG